MFDFSKMDQAFAAMGELDGLLRSIRDEQRTTNMLLAMMVSADYANRSGFPADLAGVLAQAREVALGPDART